MNTYDLAWGPELEETDHINERQVKNLTGNDVINIRGMRETNRKIKIACTQYYASNVMPEMNFADRALMIDVNRHIID